MFKKKPSKRLRVTSVGGLGFGLGWEWAATDAEIVRRLLVFLEGRRPLSLAHGGHNPRYVAASVQAMRTELTSTLQDLAPDSGASHAVRALRGACLVFLERVENLPAGPADRDDVLLALGELRGVFAVYGRELADAYHIEVYGSLAELFTAADREDERQLIRDD